jgi:PAS domain S-box-containing protein
VHVVRQFKGQDGKTLWVSSRVTVLHNEEQPERPIGYMDVSHDITRSIQAEQALRESEARYRAIVEDYQTELICRYKPNGMLTFANEVYCRYFGKSRDELIGMNFLYFIPEDERPRLIQHLSAFSPAKPVGTLEHQINLPGQGLRWLQRTDRAIFDNRGRIFEYQSVGRDITDRKALEAQIQAAQSHLIHAARLATIGEVASGVAHQIYNPLTTIIADAQILLRQLPASQPGRDSAEAIEQAGWRLQKVVQSLMEFSRPATGTLSSVSVNETIQSALSLVHASIESLGGQLEAHLDDNLPRIRGNAQQLENLWVNLLLLARDAVAVQSINGHTPTIRVASRAETPAEVKVEIWDNGRPIPVEQLATVFEPNFVGPTSGRGTGMELSICREIVRQHGGQIAAERSAEHDTIILVSLPAEI